MCDLIVEVENRIGIAQVLRVMLFNYRYFAFSKSAEELSSKEAKDLDEMIYAFKSIAGKEKNVDHELVERGLEKFCKFMLNRLPV